jgi:hypothetical protein
MGSGRGKTRRAQSSSRAYCDHQPWHAFVANHHLESEKLVEYYLGEYPLSSANRRLSGLEVEAVIRELYSDFAELGALVFPPGVNAADYQLSVREDLAVPKRRLLSDDPSRLYIRDLRHGTEAVAIPHVRSSLYEITLGEWQITNIMDLITRTIAEMK